MLIAVYSCNPFEDYHGITIHLQFLLSVLPGNLSEETQIQFEADWEIFIKLKQIKL